MMASAGDVQEITVLKSQPDSDKALELLRKIASKVKPIMKAHGWILPTLAEFFPKNPNLLGININRGKKICIRLRPASDPYSFLGLEEELIGTMLHELTHNHRGPHDDIFFKYLDSLWVEYDALVSKGYQGEGFLGVGNRVGVGVSHDGNLSLKDAREKALKTFEEKEKLRKLLGTGGALGGRPAETKGRRMGDVLADAAERRLKARKACGGDDDQSHPSGSTQQDLPPEIQKEIGRAEKDSKSYFIDLTQDDSDDEQEFGQEEFVTKKGKGKGKVKEEREESPDLIIVSSSTTSTSSTSNSKPSTSRSKPSKRPPPSPALASTSKEGWICPLCTFHNPSLHLSCTICLSERSTPPVSTKKKKLDDSRKGKRQEEKDDSWLCHVCAREMEGCWWTCRDCGTMKLTS